MKVPMQLVPIAIVLAMLAALFKKCVTPVKMDASYSANTVAKHYAAHNPTSPLISGVIENEDAVKDRIVKSCKRLPDEFVLRKY